ncbi:hypothetical protein ABFV55_27855, partial [Pseudomonas syringae]|uniref:hypothetical protein n=1 Tax=Pseudomonas syringae TaxID=317 RepID=UPI0034D97347
MASAIEGNQIDDTLSNKADVFLKVLLSLPHILLSNYIADTANGNIVAALIESKMVSEVEREEISFFFLLNYL